MAACVRADIVVRGCSALSAAASFNGTACRPWAGSVKLCRIPSSGDAVKPSTALDSQRSVVRDVASRFRTANPRVFGSVVHGTDRDGSDLDLLVDALPGATLFDLGALQDELEELLGVPVDVLTPAELPARFRDEVLAEAQPV